MKKRAAQSLLFAFGLLWGGTASATPDFPSVVVHALGLPGVTIDPPQGCQLCHATELGGTSLRPFGTILHQYGAQPYQENTLQQALGQVAQNEPQLVADIKAGRDPNGDTSTTNVHTPAYGCGATVAGTKVGESWTAFLVTLFALGVRRILARGRRRPPRSRSARR